MLATLSLLLATVVGSTYDREGSIDIADAVIVHIPSNNNTMCLVGTTDGQAHFISPTNKSWDTMRITTTLLIGNGGEVTAAASDPKGETYYVTSHGDGDASFLTVIDGKELTIITEVPLPGGASDMFYAAPYLYVATMGETVYTVNITDPQAVSILSSAVVCSGGGKITATTDYLLAACSDPPVVAVYNMTDNEVFSEVHTLLLPNVINSTITDLFYYNNGLYVLGEEAVAYVATVAPSWGVDSVWEMVWKTGVYVGTLAVSHPVGYGVGDVYVAIPGEVKQLDGDDQSVSAYVVRENNVSSISVYQQRRLFTISGKSRLAVYSLSKPRGWNALAVVAVICGAIAVVLVLGGIFYYQKLHSPTYASDERQSFRGDATADRRDFNTF